MRYTEAESLLVQLLEKKRAVLGEDHPSTLGSLNNLARLYGSQQRWEEAELAAGELLELTPEDAAEYAEREKLLELIIEARGTMKSSLSTSPVVRLRLSAR